MNWTQSDIDKIKNKRIADDAKELTLPENKIANSAKKESEPIRHIISILREYELEYQSEVMFTELRKFRFDFLLPIQKIALEYEGIISDKSRHTTLRGYTRDADKYNLASAKGYTLFRYTVLNYKNIELDLLRKFYWSRL